jgi:hypothetical protein
MDELTLFDRFHEALDIEPRPSAYERMRLIVTNPPVAMKRRSAFRMRYSKMGFRIAAGVTAAVIAIAVIAAFLAGRHVPVGSVPANQDPNVKAYQAMMASDYSNMAGSTSNHCFTIQDSGCQAALKAFIPALQKWVSDLNSFRTPSQYAVIDGQLRRHLNEATTELTAAAAFQNASNESGFNFAMNSAVYERAWIDPTTFAIVGSYPRVAGTFHDAVSIARQSLDACVNSTPGPGDLACQALLGGQTCTTGAAQTCESYVQSATTQTQTFLIALLQNPAQGALTTKGAQLMADLARADTGLLAITDGLLSGDSAKVAAGQSSYASAIVSAATDASVILNS